MFCYQCQETVMNKGCTIKGVCGKEEETAKLEDLLLYVSKSVSSYMTLLEGKYVFDHNMHFWIVNSLFMTITNANFDNEAIIEEILKGVKIRDELRIKIEQHKIHMPDKFLKFADCTCQFKDMQEMLEYSKDVGVMRSDNEDIRSLRETIIYGLKGLCAYLAHARNLEKENVDIYKFVEHTLANVDSDALGIEELFQMVIEVGKYGVDTMELLDLANTKAYGNPEATKVNIGVRDKPGILISGHDLKDLEDLLDQTKGTGVDVYTHCEMLPAHAYPFFKKYDNLVGNYGDSWWHQTKEFQDFNGPILFTSNCIVPPRGIISEYLERVFTTNSAGLDGCKHIDEKKDFSEIINIAKNCKPPKELEDGFIDNGFAHNQIFNVIDKVLEAINEGDIKHFFVMAGCDARMQDRKYYTEFAQKLPKDTVILTAGCAKFRYNKLNLGDINGIPRVLDAGQCNDSYSLAVVALKLKEILGKNSVNELPITFNIAWYEQKAVLVLLSLLYLGFKNIHIGPTIPAFLSPNILKVLIEKFQLGTITTANEDLEKFLWDIEDKSYYRHDY